MRLRTSRVALWQSQTHVGAGKRDGQEQDRTARHKQISGHRSILCPRRPVQWSPRHRPAIGSSTRQATASFVTKLALSPSPRSSRRIETVMPAIRPCGGGEGASRTRRPGPPSTIHRPRKSACAPACAHQGGEPSLACAAGRRASAPWPAGGRWGVHPGSLPRRHDSRRELTGQQRTPGWPWGSPLGGPAGEHVQGLSQVHPQRPERRCAGRT